ncbi:hypothetical protein FDP41_004941 [Naegleria fowleri]|uniref:Uncharacterized protein n=1 Tax=Naegleria fowleri TaxID=5763 RepID=A0A6A5BMV1_NAEFO|nr:uncharacterized protein FDP41_004941 [Naegleria fowleri]KAF0976266.1 hypothetical protein FDP41_004941 [Naegleria fowleri]CAG4716451.1 unnamed protein product [Naegleria fowleri]
MIGLLAVSNWGNLFRTFGGSAFSFHSTKMFVYGKYVRVIEYPFGDMRTIRLNINSYEHLKKRIAEAHGLDTSSIQQVHRYEENWWTEKINDNEDVRSLKEYHILLWSRSTGHIPTRNVNLKEIPDEVNQEAEALAEGTGAGGKGVSESLTTTDHKHDGGYSTHDKTVTTLSFVHHLKKKDLFTDEEYQILTELILQHDPYILSLHTNFKDDENSFVIYAKRKVIDYTVGFHAISLPQNLRQKKTGVKEEKDKDEENDLNAVY